MALFREQAKTTDIIITTALIPASPRRCWCHKTWSITRARLGHH